MSQNNIPVNPVVTVTSSANSSYSASEPKADSPGMLAGTETNGTQYEMPVKPASAYISVSIICLMVAFGGFIFGWDTGTISGFVNQTDFIPRFGQINSHGESYLSKVRIGLIVSIFCIGCAIGGLLFSKLGDTIGRKMALVTVTVVYIVGILISITSMHAWYQYFIGRIISGMGVGGIAVYSPLLISEVSPKHLRGTLVSCSHGNHPTTSKTS